MVGTTTNYREGNQPVISMFEKKFTGINFFFKKSQLFTYELKYPSSN